MKHRLVPALLVLLALAGAGTAFAQVDVAYAHVSLAIRYGGSNAPTFEVNASIYPRLPRETFCLPTARCAGGVATPVGYVYDPYTFTVAPERHDEEILHLRQWEALGPAYLLAYLLTGGDAFEPYHSRGLFPATQTNKKPGTSQWDMARMWTPPADLERSFPQFRLSWGGEHDSSTPSASFFPGYGDALRGVSSTLASAL